jgi:hypothetical protein
VLEGSIQPLGDQIRVTAQLIDTKTGGHVWSGGTIAPQRTSVQSEVTGRSRRHSLVTRRRREPNFTHQAEAAERSDVGPISSAWIPAWRRGNGITRGTWRKPSGCYAAIEIDQLAGLCRISVYLRVLEFGPVLPWRQHGPGDGRRAECGPARSSDGEAVVLGHAFAYRAWQTAHPQFDSAFARTTRTFSFLSPGTCRNLAIRPRGRAKRALKPIPTIRI